MKIVIITLHVLLEKVNHGGKHLGMFKRGDMATCVPKVFHLGRPPKGPHTFKSSLHELHSIVKIHNDISLSMH